MGVSTLHWRPTVMSYSLLLTQNLTSIILALKLCIIISIFSLYCTRVNNRISDTGLNRTPAQQIRETWRRGLSMITYLSPHEACIPAMAIEVPPVLVWQARIHAVRSHRCSDVLTIRRTGGMLMSQVLLLRLARRI